MTGKSLVLRVLVLVATIATVSGCSDSDHPETSATLVVQSVAPMTTVESIVITSGKHYFEDKSSAVSKRLTELVNSGKYNLTEVTTTYTNQWLTAATVRYLPNSEGTGNTVRVALLMSTRHYWDDVTQDVESQLVKAKNAYKPFRVQTTVVEGRILAAEAWYKKKGD